MTVALTSTTSDLSTAHDYPRVCVHHLGHRICVVLVIASALLGGCAHQKPVAIDDWSRHEIAIQKLHRWELLGKLGVRVPGDSGSATLRWQQNKNHYTIDLSGPFGQGRVLIEGKPGKVSLQRPGNAPLKADSAEELIQHATGWTVPVAQLTYWVRGVPDPHQVITRIEQNELGLLGSLEQAGWHLTYSNYQRVTQGNTVLQLPGRIIAQYGEDIRLTLIIRQWQPNS